MDFSILMNTSKENVCDAKEILLESNFCFYSEVVKWNSWFITILEWFGVAASVKHDSLAAFSPPGDVWSRRSRCSALKRHVTALANNHVGACRVIQNIGWHWE